MSLYSVYIYMDPIYHYLRLKDTFLY